MLPFLKYKKLYLIISATIMILMSGALVLWGLNPGIDFTGGSIVEFKNEGLTIDNRDEVQSILSEKGIEVRSVFASGENSLEVKAKEMSQEQLDQALAALKEKYEQVEVVNFETVGPSVGQEQIKDTFVAVSITILALLLYIAWRFENRRYGVTAVVALVHDVLVILGIFAILGRFMGVEVDLMFVTATLTAMTFSVHDTIVVYDRVRESLRRNPKAAFEPTVNQALNETIVRSLSTSMSLVFVLLALLLLGGESIRWFVFALLIGTISGTYSSPFTATPLLVVWHEWKSRKS